MQNCERFRSQRGSDSGEMGGIARRRGGARKVKTRVLAQRRFREVAPEEERNASLDTDQCVAEARLPSASAKNTRHGDGLLSNRIAVAPQDATKQYRNKNNDKTTLVSSIPDDPSYPHQQICTVSRRLWTLALELPAP